MSGYPHYGQLYLRCIDAHPTEPWIISGHERGKICIWSYDNSKISDDSKDTYILEGHLAPPNCVKIIPRQKRIVVGTDDGLIHVYKCAPVAQMKEITSFRDHDNDGRNDTSLAVHAVQPFVFSTSLKLWNWKENWNCTQTFHHAGRIRQVVFNPEDANSFATVPHNHPIVQVWSLDSPEPSYTLSGHSDKVNCLAFFRRGGGQYLITGSDDGTAKIWDLEIKACIHTLEAIMSSITCVSSLPGRRPYIVTGSENGSIHVWTTTDFRLRRIVHYGSGGPVRGLVCLMGSRRVVIGQENAISVIDIGEGEADASQGGSNIGVDNEEAVASRGANDENSDLYSCISWLPGMFCSIFKRWSP